MFFLFFNIGLRVLCSNRINLLKWIFVLSFNFYAKMRFFDKWKQFCVFFFCCKSILANAPSFIFFFFWHSMKRKAIVSLMIEFKCYETMQKCFIFFFFLLFALCRQISFYFDLLFLVKATIWYLTLQIFIRWTNKHNVLFVCSNRITKYTIETMSNVIWCRFYCFSLRKKIFSALCLGRPNNNKGLNPLLFTQNDRCQCLTTSEPNSKLNSTAETHNKIIFDKINMNSMTESASRQDHQSVI